MMRKSFSFLLILIVILNSVSCSKEKKTTRSMMEVDPSNFIPNTGVSYNDPREDQSDTPDVIKAIKEVHHNGQYSSDHYDIGNGNLQIEPGLDYKDYLLPGNRLEVD